MHLITLRLLPFLLITLGGSALAAEAKPLAAARAHLKQGAFDRVLDDLADSDKLPGQAVADVLGEAAAMAARKGDKAMASLYCEMALRREAREPRALRICATIAVEEGRFDDAERWGDTLGELFPKDAEVALLRAQGARARESWDLVVVLLEPHQADKVLRDRIAPLLAEAREHQKQETEVRARQDDVDTRLAQALREARDSERARAIDEQKGPPPGAKKKDRPVGEDVFIYTTRRCGDVCARARAWLEENGVEYKEKDIDRGHITSREAWRVCQKAGIKAPTCPVPLFEINGVPVAGFNLPRLKELLEL